MNGELRFFLLNFSLFRFVFWRGLVRVLVGGGVSTVCPTFGFALVAARLAVRGKLLGLVAAAVGLARIVALSPSAISKFGQLIARTLSQALATNFDKLIFDELEAPALPRNMRPRRASSMFETAPTPSPYFTADKSNK